MFPPGALILAFRSRWAVGRDKGMGCNNSRVAKKDILGARQQSWILIAIG